MKYLFSALSIVLFVAWNPAPAQIYDHDYTPAELMKEEGVKVVTVYRTEVEDPEDFAGKGNRIRLARKLIREIYLDREGRPERGMYYHGEDEEMTDWGTYRYNTKGLLEESSSHHKVKQAGTRGLVDTTQLTVTTHQRRSYDGQGRLILILNLNEKDGNQFATDSIVTEYDGQGRPQSRIQFDLKGENKVRSSTAYEYKAGNKCIATTTYASGSISEEITVTDAIGRVLSTQSNLGRMSVVETNTYHPRGWLETIEFERENPVMKGKGLRSQKNVYDDHGKLIEMQFDYENGKRVFEFYDYTYYVDED